MLVGVKPKSTPGWFVRGAKGGSCAGALLLPSARGKIQFFAWACIPCSVHFLKKEKVTLI